MGAIKTEIQMPYDVGKTIQKGVKPVAGFVGLKFLIQVIGKKLGTEVSDDMSGILAVSLIGAFDSIVNIAKNWKK